MKFLRLLLTCLVVILTLALVVVLLAIAPAVQTWIAQHELTSTPGVKGSLDSLSAGFGEVDVENLHLETNGAVLTVPSLKAKLTLTDAVVRRQFHIQSLVAKGWSLDLSHSSEAGNPPLAGSATVTSGGTVSQADTANVRKTLNVILGLLSQRKLPYDGSLDGVDMEGEVLFTPIPGKETARVHVVLNGGGLSVGSEGVFNFDLTGTIPDTSLPVSAASAHGKLTVSMDSHRTLNRIRIDTDLTDNSSSAQPTVTVGAQVASASDSEALTYSFDITRAARKLVSVAANLSGPDGQLSGTWVVDLVDSDITRYFPDMPFPSATLAGKGRFDADLGFSRLHVVGSMASDVSHLDAIAPLLKSVGAVKVAWDFDDTRSGRQIRVDRLKVSISGAQPIAEVTALQSFTIAEGNWAITSSDPSKDLFDVSIIGLPLAWMPPASGMTLSGGNASGEVLIGQPGAGFELRSKGTLVASGASLLEDGAVIGKGLNFSLATKAHEDPTGWRAEFSPLGIDSGGRNLASFEGSASRSAAADAGIVLTLKWKADLDAIKAEGAAPAVRWLKARAASGDILATFGATTQVDGKADVVGHDSNRSFTASVHAEIDPNGGVTFQAPVKVASGTGVSDLTFEGTCGRDSGGPWIDLKLGGGKVAAGDLVVLFAPFAQTDLAPEGAGQGPRDRVPFWGDLTGRVVASFDEFSTKYSDLSNVGGTFTIDKGSIELEGGRGGPTGNILTNVDGSIVFDAAAESPYILKGTAASTELEASSFLAKPRSGQDPVFEGKFNVTRAYAGKGRNLYDLAAHSGEEFHITSTSGIVRMLKANVADSITEAPSGVTSDTLSTVGTVVGTVMGTKANILDSGKTKLSKNTEAVLQVTYQFAEIGYDKVDVTAFRGFDGAVALTHVEMVNSEVHLTGTGHISYSKGHAFADQPLSLDLQLGVQGETGDLMTRAALLSTAKDALGYTMLGQTLHFGGTLNHIDTSQWNDLLVKAAAPKPDAAKKGD